MRQKNNAARGRKIFVISIIIFVCVSSILFEHINKANAKAAFRSFDSADLKGRITHLYTTRGGERFRLDNGKEYKFFSILSGRNGSNHFYQAADIDDSVFKPALFDTLVLVKKNTGRRYTFTFRSF